MTLLKTSLPRESVPKMWASEGGCRIRAGEMP